MSSRLRLCRIVSSVLSRFTRLKIRDAGVPDGELVLASTMT